MDGSNGDAPANARSQDRDAQARGLRAAPGLRRLSAGTLEAMLDAGLEVLECYRALAKAGSNVVAEVLRGQGTFFEWQHYPKGDVFDPESHAQYFYHAHPHGLAEGEHGHFHTFLRAPGMPEGIRPADTADPLDPVAEAHTLSHIVAIAMNDQGYPIRLFTTNRWVTNENWYRAEDVVRMVERFAVDHTAPSWATNRWITAMVRLFAPDIAALLHQRDETVEEWRAQARGGDAFEARELEILSYLDISVESRVAELCRLLERAPVAPAPKS